MFSIYIWFAFGHKREYLCEVYIRCEVPILCSQMYLRNGSGYDEDVLFSFGRAMGA